MARVLGRGDEDIRLRDHHPVFKPSVGSELEAGKAYQVAPAERSTWMTR